MKSIFKRIKALFFCEHRWVNPAVLRDYNFRGGYEHTSVKMECSKCGRHRTFEGHV